MKFHYLIVLFVIFLVPFKSYALTIDEERAQLAVDIFMKACFLNYRNKEKTVSFLDENFQRLDDEKTQIFFKFTKTENGIAWVVNLPNGNFSVVLSDLGNCHVLAQKADKSFIHKEIEHLYETTIKELTPNVIFHPKEKTKVKTSTGFEVKGTTGKNLIVVIASTPAKSQSNKPDALITMAVKPY